MEAYIQELAGELRLAYGAQDLTVVSTRGHEDFLNSIKGIKKPDLVGRPNTTFVGMLFLPAFQNKDGQPYIIVRAEEWDRVPNLLRDDLTHEFSNYEVWNRWGGELFSFGKRVFDHDNLVFENYKERVLRQADAEGDTLIGTRNHPARQLYSALEAVSFAFIDSVLSVPTDHVTIEKGFDERLKARKLRKSLIWVDNSSDTDGSRWSLIGHLPYIAYNAFHPQKPEVEAELENCVIRMLEIVRYKHALAPVRRIRELLHDIRLPVDSANFLTVYTDIQRTYFSYMSNRGRGDVQKYWQMLEDSVKAALETNST